MPLGHLGSVGLELLIPGHQGLVIENTEIVNVFHDEQTLDGRGDLAHGRQISTVTMDAGLRVLEAARLFELLKGPAVEGPEIIASGGVTEHDAAAAPEAAALRRALLDAGIPENRIVLESESKNTRDEVVIVKRMLAERRVTSFVLVTSPLHMRRSMLAFEQQGMRPIPSPALLVPEVANPRPAWLPSSLWLGIADDAIYEWLARGWYWWNGWLG